MIVYLEILSGLGEHKKISIRMVYKISLPENVI